MTLSPTSRVVEPGRPARTRRGVRPEDHGRWIFNRIADVYPARPPYPDALIEDIAALAPEGGKVVDIGAGTGSLALPLAERGLDVVAVEPAEAMLAELRAFASHRGVKLRADHAAAESLPLEDESQELAVVADALHFLALEPAARELYRVLVRRGALAIVTIELAATPYMRQVARIVEDASQRRPRAPSAAVAQLAAAAKIRLERVRVFHDETEMTASRLERILRSISFVGPAMNTERFEAFRTRILSIDQRPVWARTLTLHTGRKTRRARL